MLYPSSSLVTSVAIAVLSGITLITVMRGFKKTPREIFWRAFASKIKLIDAKDYARLSAQQRAAAKYEMIVRDNRVFERIMKDGNLGLADGYVEGEWHSDNLQECLEKAILHNKQIVSMLKVNAIALFAHYAKHRTSSRLRKLFGKYLNFGEARQQIEHHYDKMAKEELMDRMLGKYKIYTCAYFHEADMSLDEAQLAKMKLVALKLDLKPGMKVLDIGCGYGTLADYLAKTYGVEVVGVTLSKSQKKYADTHFGDNELIDIQLIDYRKVTEETHGLFDRIYSVGMFEAIGRERYEEYFEKCDELLVRDGIMFIHTIGTNQRIWRHKSFINKYIFPGGELPNLASLSEKFSDKWILQDFQNFGMSYAKTLNCWKANIRDWRGLDDEVYDARFRRVWTYYLDLTASGFVTESAMLWHLVYTKRHSLRFDNCDYMQRRVDVE
mmetsp:Transcript_52139/g.83086  ORF Transcript_52139/g.83086 Transcript_52139/m.83086 type:complete len:440 (+) Transcript_52139:80-1399(+)